MINLPIGGFNGGGRDGKESVKQLLDSCDSDDNSGLMAIRKEN